jgi:hypothetical protein
MADLKCYVCKQTFTQDCFNKDKQTKSGFARSCKVCHRKRAKQYYEKNNVQVNENNLARYYSNHEDNKIKCLQYYYNNKHTVFKNCAKRRCSKLLASPSWVDKKHEDRIGNIYKASINTSHRTGIQHHVDHIVPLQGKTVCGLHVWWNLRIIPAKINLSKGNRAWPNMWGIEN